MTRTPRLLVASTLAVLALAGPAAAAGHGPSSPAPVIVALPGLPPGAGGTLTLTAPTWRSSPLLTLRVTGLAPSSVHTLRLGSCVLGGRVVGMTLRADAAGTLRVKRALPGARLRPAGSAPGGAPSVWDDTDIAC